jgi:hypothetical protein
VLREEKWEKKRNPELDEIEVEMFPKLCRGRWAR